MPRPKVNRQVDKRLAVIRHWLIRGDLVLIAKATGYTVKYVEMVMKGQRWNRKIIMKAIERARQNKEMMKEEQLTEIGQNG